MAVWYLITALAVIFLLWILVKLYFKKVGDCDICIESDILQDVCYRVKDHYIYIRGRGRFLNRGSQQGLLIDCSVSLPHLELDYESPDIDVSVNNLSNLRIDGYWETYIIKPGKFTDFEITVKYPLGSKTPEKFISMVKELKIDIEYKFYCRYPVVSRQETIKADLSDVSEKKIDLFHQDDEPSSKEAQVKDVPDNVVLIKTHLLTEKDDIFDVIEKLVKPKTFPGDIICIAETALAIMQGRFRFVDDITPGFWARNLNKFFDQNSSMSSVYALQMAINEVGPVRIILAVFTGILGKFIGRSGDFYRIAGKDVAAIDDCSGTLPPYDKCVVMGPRDSSGVVSEIKRKTGIDAAVVDANDLGKVDVFAISDDKYKNLVMRSLVKNPQGNASEQTPIVIVRSVNF
ncbi:MAG: coenzyme F420-0:L-glutamate ligase [Armatimonadota bacterium]